MNSDSNLTKLIHGIGHLVARLGGDHDATIPTGWDPPGENHTLERGEPSTDEIRQAFRRAYEEINRLKSTEAALKFALAEQRKIVDALVEGPPPE